LQVLLRHGARKKKPLQEELNNLEEQIKQIQIQPLALQDHTLEASLVARYEQTMTKLTDSYMQRAKKQWIKDGDRNTSFFHNAIAKRKRRNTIVSVKDENGVMQYMPDGISNTFVNYFRSIFASTNANSGRPFMGTQPPQDTHDYTYSLPDNQEIFDTLKDMKRNASPGPDGFNVEFYIATWEWIGQDVVQLVRNFFQTGIMPAHINDTHIALIPKKLVPLVPADYRPISLCNVIYKIIAKCLANRLKPHLPDYVHHSQQAFIEGRRISNNIIIAQEITHSFALSSWKNQSFMLKIDLAKAFDRLEWNFIVAALNRKGLHGHFINLIHSCVSSPTFSIVINGQPFARFHGHRGIRQGCPLSPYLFVLAINDLSIALQEAMSDKRLAGITLGPNCPPIHSLLFADDLLVCGEATVHEATKMKNILQEFYRRSGQTPNWSKSGIIFSKHVPLTTIHSIKQIFHVPFIDNNFVHLGHPLILPGKDRASAYNFVFDKFKSKLNTYKADKLSHAARLALIKSVFASIPVYYMSNILFSKKFIAKLIAIIRTFWWTGVREEASAKSLCLRAWKDICTPKKEGGLGIKNLQATNQALILMAAWRIAEHPNDFLHAVLKSKYFPDSSIWRPNPNAPRSAFWASIIKILPILKDHSFYQITQGQISVWSTPWCQNWTQIYDALIIQPSSFTYPAQVRDLWIPDQQTWNNQLIDTLFQPPMASIIKNTQIICSEDEDILCWKLTPTGKCNTKTAYRACLQNLQEHGEPTPRQVNPATIQLLNKIWENKQVTPRVQTFGWRLLRKALATGARAGKYSKHISKLCSRCGMEETEIHLFFTCNFIRAAWFTEPWYIRTDALITNTTSLTQVILNLLNMNHPHATLSNILTFKWCTWKSRNDNLFNRKQSHPNQIHHMAEAIKHSLEMVDVSQAPTNQINTCRTSLSSMQVHGQVKGLILGSSKQERMEEEAPKQGTTITTDLTIEGPKIYSDAAWKTTEVSGADGRRTTGLGVFCQVQQDHQVTSIFVQASSGIALSPLHAESLALLLASNTANLLQLRQATFLTDNLTLAKAAAATKTADPQVPWEIRNYIAQHKKITRGLRQQIYHISRELNGAAHNCAHQAIRHLQSEPTFRCSNSAHVHGYCPTLLAMKNLEIQGIVLHVVNCC
jgi:hypothetical protein